CFVFSSRRRHTRFDCDWSSDVCSSDLERFPQQAAAIIQRAEKNCRHHFDLLGHENLHYGPNIDWHLDLVHGKRAPSKPWFELQRSEERRVGKECSSGGTTNRENRQTSN